MGHLNQGTSKTRREIFLAEHRRLSRRTPLVESDEQAIKSIKYAIVYFQRIHEIERPQIREELFNYAFVFYKKRKRELKATGEELREGLLVRMTVTQLKKFVERDRIQSEYGFSMSGSKALQAGLDQEILVKLKEYANEGIMKPGWNNNEPYRDLRMVIDTLPSIDRFILHLMLEPIDKSDIILILEANDVKNARALISKALLQLRTRYRSNN